MKCRWYQFLINRALDDERPIPANATRHLENCARCQDFWERQRRMIQRMHEAAGDGAEGEPSPFLRRRILNQIEGEQPVPARFGLGRWVWGGVSASAIVALVALLPLLKQSRSNVGPGSAQADVVSVALLEQTSRFTSGGNLLRAATNIDQPLHKELNLVISDAQNALHSLREELLPSHLLAKGD